MPERRSTGVCGCASPEAADPGVPNLFDGDDESGGLEVLGACFGGREAAGDRGERYRPFPEDAGERGGVQEVGGGKEPH